MLLGLKSCCFLSLLALASGAFAQQSSSLLRDSSMQYAAPLTVGAAPPVRLAHGVSAAQLSPAASSSTLRRPSLSAAAGWVLANGHVAANTYTAVITYQDLSGRETTPSPESDISGNSYGTVTTHGDQSTLFVGAQEAIPGATCFNVYIRTQGHRHFYKQGGCTKIGELAVLSSTPVASGKQPPSAADAKSSPVTSVAPLHGKRLLGIPPYIHTTGVAGDPEPGQIYLDRWHGTIHISCAGGTPWKTSTYAAVKGCLNLDMSLPPLQYGQQVQAASFVVHAEQHPFYGGGITPSEPPSVIALTAGAYRDNTRDDSIWGELVNIAFTGMPKKSLTYGSEVAMFNQSGKDAVSAAGGVGYHAASLGIHKPMYGSWITAAKPRDAWRTGLRIEDGSAGTGIYIGRDIATGMDVYSPMVLHQTAGSPLTIIAHEGGANASIRLVDPSGTRTVGEWEKNGALRWGGGKAIASSSDVIESLAGVTGSIGGAALTAGTCISGKAPVPGAVIGEPVLVSATDGSLPSGRTILSAAVTAKDTVTVQICGVAPVTPAVKKYNVHVVN